MNQTEQLFRQDAYLRECTARVVAADDEAIVLDRTVFYPLGGDINPDSLPIGLSKSV